MCVAQVMKTDALVAVFVGKSAPLLAWCIVMERRTVPSTDYAPIALPDIADAQGDIFLILSGFVQKGEHGGGQRYKTFTGFCFGGAVSCPSPVDRL